MPRITFFCAAFFLTLLFQQNYFAQDARFRVPLNGATVACTFDTLNCYVSGKHHTGVDYYASNRDILATAPGKVVKIQYDDTSGTNSDH